MTDFWNQPLPSIVPKLKSVEPFTMASGTATG